MISKMKHMFTLIATRRTKGNWFGFWKNSSY